MTYEQLLACCRRLFGVQAGGDDLHIIAFSLQFKVGENRGIVAEVFARYLVEYIESQRVTVPGNTIN